MPPNLEQIDAICARLRVGAFERVAVESAGISWRDYEMWMSDGGRPDCPVECKLLLESVRQARADGRLASEIELRKQDQKTWLLCGPGRQTATQEGWGPAEKSVANNLTQERGAVMELAALMLDALIEFPDARIKAVDAINRSQAARIPT